MGASLKKAGCGVPQIVLRDAALSKMIGSDKAAVGAEFSAPTAALPGCRPVILPPCRPADLPTYRLVVYIKDRFSPPILASAKRKINSAWRGVFLMIKNQICITLYFCIEKTIFQVFREK